MSLPDFLTLAPDGEIRLTAHRIGLYDLIWYYNEGYSPEMLVCQFPTVPLALVHKVVAWYLENQAEADHYVAACNEEMTRQREANSRRLDVAALRQRMERLRLARGSTPAESA